MSTNYWIGAVIVLLLLTGGWYVFSQPKVAEGEVIKIGFIAPLTGPFADWAESIKNGVELALEDTKHDFVVDYQDDACEPTQAVTVAQKFFATDLKFIIGPGCDGSLQAVAPLARQYGAIQFSTGLLGDDIFSANPTNLLNLATQISTEADFMAAHLASKEIKKVAIVHGDNLFGVEYGKRLPEALERKNIEVTVNETTRLSETDFRTTVLKIMKTNPEAVFIHQGEAQIGILAKQLRESGASTPLFAYYGTESGSLLEAGGAALEGLEYTYPVNSAEGSTGKTNFEKRYSERFGDRVPTATSYFAYDGMMLLDKAFGNCSSDDAECVERFLKNYGEYEGVSGLMRFEQDGKNIRPFGIKKIENGKFIWITKEMVL